MIPDEYFILEVNRKKLIYLTTYKDGEGILRVKTKITYRKDSEDLKNPIILLSHHQVVERLIMIEHKRNSHTHTGLQMLFKILHQHYWILNARITVRSVLSKCVICLRHSKRNVTIPSATLPENGINVAVFEIIGFDLAGPLYLKGGSKAWVCICTCAVFRAVHFELLSSFRRSIARRGRPSIVYCDNGNNFIDASN
ncbi:hypothetical protein AVEN_132552-1 [Araneus ventricosus]|uniref:Uncharacterized protein n=1 Tax=Araneus ventricosus TaxID=182803 RepID=A0A4Y2LAF2_ARAVE|nr:hypothetical protein AVEN_132552-1 [Araneus ventricosus]